MRALVEAQLAMNGGPCTLTAGGDHYSDRHTIANYFWPPDRVFGTFLSLVLLTLVNVDLAGLIIYFLVNLTCLLFF
jgi:hypothetical protein